ncbi:uncharacterized protein C7orf31 homolog [Scleropages formosus]|uniref:uncharacterized protein C7orf31 homolog n=1 Tax=Scleropages formosus TaxID=113540 RepID=UPI0010FABBE2|nr:uncharacterized protein C7orf31 homolog [Scleropages formosus]
MTTPPQRAQQLPGGTEGHMHSSYGGSVIPDEKLTKTPIQRQHPFESHISRFALFPTFSSPDDADTGVRSTARSSLNPLIPTRAQDVTVLSKTKGAPFRHEVHLVGREKALTWPGQQGFYHSPAKTSEVLYPPPPKAVCPNPSLRPWSATLCERTARMLRNLERSRWVTSHQLDFTGSGPMNPIKLDDFHEKTIAMVAGVSPYIVQLREQSHPQFIPAKPMNGYKQRIREGHHFLQHHCPPTIQYDGHTDQASSSPERTDQGSQNDSHKRTPIMSGLATGHPWSDTELREGRRITCTSFSGPPWSPPISSHRGIGAPLSRSRSILLALQDSFSKTEAHRCFQQSLQGSPADLRDSIRTGKRHCFYGFNSYYFHD